MKLSQLFRTMREELHIIGAFRLPLTPTETELYGEGYKYCFVGLVQCKAGYYDTHSGEGTKIGEAMTEVEAFEKFETSADRYERKYPCPEKGCDYHPLHAEGEHMTGMRLRHMLVHLNDDHKYTFEQGAAWLESEGL